MKSLFHCLVALVFCMFFADFASAQCCSGGSGIFGIRGRIQERRSSSSSSYASAPSFASSGASFCGPCAYAGVPCSPENCAVACAAGCSTGCPGASITASDGRKGHYVVCPTCPSGFAFVPDPVSVQQPVAITYKTINGITYKCQGNTCEVVTKSAYPPLTEGEHVSHPANPAGLFPAGTGTVEKAVPLNSGKGKVYTVKCDKTGKSLPVAFEDGELWSH